MYVRKERLLLVWVYIYVYLQTQNYNGLGTLGKTKRSGKTENDYSERDSVVLDFFYVVKRCSKISFSSSVEKLSSSSLLDFMYIISLAISIFHLLSSSMSQYLNLSMSSILSSSMVILSVNNSRFLRFEPVFDLLSYLMNLRRCFGTSLVDFSIWLRKLKNLRNKTFFR